MGASISALVVALGAVVVVRAFRPPVHTFQGIVQLSDNEGLKNYIEGDSCSGSGGYDDIATQAEVTVFDASNAILGTSRLSSGKMQDGYCRFPFKVAKVKESDIYQIEVGREGRGKLRYGKSDAQRLAYTFSLSLGNGIPVPERPACPSNSDVVSTVKLEFYDSSASGTSNVSFAVEATNRSSMNVTFDVNAYADFANGSRESGSFARSLNAGESEKVYPHLDVATSLGKPTNIGMWISSVATSELCK